MGGFNDNFGGIGLDPITGEPNPMELGVQAKDLGATVVAMAGLDPATHVPGGRVIRAVMT